MSRLRAFLRHRRHLAFALVMIALAMKACVPAGFMLSIHDNLTLSVTVCNGMGETTTMSIPVERDSSGKLSMDKQQCQAGMGDLSLIGGDLPGWIVAAILFALALGFSAVVLPTLPAPRYLLPPMRGPPATI